MMGKSGFLFKLASSETAYVVSTCPDLGVFGDVFGKGAWERLGRIDLTSAALKACVWKPDAALKELEERYWYLSTLEDER
jgi:hypothetical protein